MSNHLKIFDFSRFDQSLDENQQHIQLFREALKSATELMQQQYLAGADICDLVHDRSDFLDQILIRAWGKFVAQTSEDIALVAVGGFGRGELHPGSDIDLLILMSDIASEKYNSEIECFLVFLWDIGLEVGHSTRTLTECRQQAADDITIATNLMEARLLVGAKKLFERMRVLTGPRQVWPSDRFFEAKWQEQQARHHKFHDTAYNLEPNIKEGPGGLRDIQMIGWVAKRHFGAKNLHDLVHHQFLTESEYLSLMEGQKLLWHIRWGLHSISGRREDRLLFDHQRTLALQFKDTQEEGNQAIEEFMQHYYRTVMELGRLNEMLLQLFQEAILYNEDHSQPVMINRRFQSRRGFLEVTSDQVFKRFPFALMEMYLILAQHEELKGVRASTIRLVRYHCTLIDDKFRSDLRVRSLFIELLRQPRGITHELRHMNRYGVLAAYIPAFANIVGRMQYDLFHAYTVDEHILFVVRNLRRFSIPEFHNEFPLCSEIFENIPKPELLYIGGLFHDIAKGRRGDHSVLGEQDAEQFCLQHGLSQFDSNLVAWMVRNHLIMSMTAQRKDISDPDVVKSFAGIMGDQMHLDYLYLLTVADIRGTNPELWNSWRAALLKELYQATKRELRRGLEQPIDEKQRIEETKNQASILLKEKHIDLNSVAQIWAIHGSDYFLRYFPDEIAWHSQAIINHADPSIPLVLVRREVQRGSTAIFIYTKAKDHLFATITATLEKVGLNIVDARIIASSSGYTLDTYLALEQTGEPIEDTRRMQEIHDSISSLLSKSEPSKIRVSRHQPRRNRHFKTPTQVKFRQDLNNNRTIMEVIASDFPGMLSHIGQAFNQCKIRLQNARIATIGARVEDVFFITDFENNPLTEPLQEKLSDTITNLLSD